MNKVRVTVPATTANLGPGLDGLALALGLHNVIEISEIEYGFGFDIHGEGIDRLSYDPDNLVAQAAIRVFQAAGCAPSGIHVTLMNGIPLDIGLGSSAAATLGGAVAANVMLGNPLSREALLTLTAEIEGRSNAVAAALLGGLVVSHHDDGELVYASLPIAPMQIVIIQPYLDDSCRVRTLSDTVALSDATFNIARAALIPQALASGDFELLARAMRDRLHEPQRCELIPGYHKVVEVAHRYGAAAVTVSGSGPSLIVFSPGEHEMVARAVLRAFRSEDVPARYWILPIDTQGVSISEMGVKMAFADRRRPIPASSTPAPLPVYGAPTRQNGVGETLHVAAANGSLR
ncbi:MAG: homoserine kinase [Chloroflexi bacterium]|nr:homoserine kinase [Chloroflexota bacterium]